MFSVTRNWQFASVWYPFACLPTMCKTPDCWTSSPGLCTVTLKTQPPWGWTVTSLWCLHQAASLVGKGQFFTGIRCFQGLTRVIPLPGLGIWKQVWPKIFFFLSFVFQWAAFWTIRIFLHSQPCSWLFGLWGAPLALRLCSWCPWLWRFPSGLCPWRACTALSEDPDSLAVCPLCYPAPDSTPPPGSLTNLWKGAGVGSRLASELV